MFCRSARAGGSSHGHPVPANVSIMAHLVCDPFRVFADPPKVPGVRYRSPLAEVCCPIRDTSHLSPLTVPGDHGVLGVVPARRLAG
jgi:hypothetical protein